MFTHVKPLIQSKQFWIALAQALVGVYTAVVAVNPTVSNIGIVATVIGVVQIFLRYNSTSVISGIVSTPDTETSI